MTETRNGWKAALIGFARMVGVAVVTTAFIIGGLTIAYRGQTKQQNEVFEGIRNGTLTQVCVLALPVDPETGRDPEAVAACLHRYGLEP